MAWILASVLGPVCKRMMDGTIEEYRLVRDVNDEIMNLRRTVFVIMRKLEDAEKKQVESHAIRLRLKELKQVLFDAEDVFDEIATDEALERDAEEGTNRQLKVRNPNIFGVDILLSRRAIAHRVKDINKRFDDILRDEEMLGLHVSNEPSESVDRPIRRTRQDTSSLLPKEARIIGRDDDMRKLEELLLEYSEEGTVAPTSHNYKNVHVISVVGMGGVGKTTLVQHAYNSLAVAEYFQWRMWVCVSNYFDVERITREIMDAAASSSKETRDEFVDTSNWDVVQKSLQVKLEGKRFLLVLDDVWEEDPLKWDSLCTPLMYGGRGSKIIVTTRSQKVASITKGTPIFLKDLPSDDLWSIFQTYAFDGHDPDKNTQLVILGRKIVDQLKGSPLAAKTIGRLLNSNQDVKHWRNIMKSKTWMSLDFKNSIVPILKLSYDYLPGHLKQCFAYCSLFPEDHHFDKDELVQLWMAQQFIQSHEESMGGEYCDDLACMSLFEKYTNDYGLVGFVMHDLIHNLAGIVSEEDCLRLGDNQQNGTISDTVRHVSIASNRFDLTGIEQLCNKCENMRTLLFLCGCPDEVLDPHLDNIFKKLRRLRVLRLSNCGLHGYLPTSIGALKHLRFLDLSFNHISMLPESLCDLRNLQVLDLFSCGPIRALPRNMSALINLRHLIVEEEQSFLVSGIQGLGKLTALHELDGFDCARQSMKELADMGMLRRLRIRSLEKVKSREEAAGSRLDKKEHLDELTLEWSRGRDNHLINSGLEEEVLDSLQPPHSSIRRLAIYNYGGSDDDDDDDDDVNHPGLEEEEVLDSLQPPHSSIRELSIRNYGGTRSPSWMEEDQLLSSSLEALGLSLCRNWEVLPPLGLLLCLHSLKIERMRRVRRIGPAFMGCCRQLPQGGFPSLQVLEFVDMKEWEEWEVPLLGTDIDDGGVDDQVVLSEAPPLPLFLARLQELRIQNCPKLRQLPPLPPTLTKLYIENVGLTHLPEWQLPPSSSSEAPSLPLFLARLRELRIENCPKLRQLPPLPPTLTELYIRNVGLTHLPEWWLPPSSSSEAPSLPLFLARLRELTIMLCPKLRQLPPLPPTLTKLKIENVGLTHLPEWWLPPSSASSLLPCCSSSSASLSSLEIEYCPELTSLADGLLRHPLPNLVKLVIYNCEGLVSLPPDTAFGHLTSLKELVVMRCPKLAWPSTCESPSLEEEEDTGLPPSLESITIKGVCREAMEQMMLAIVGSRQKLACLRKLYIQGCFSRLPPPPTLRRSLPSSLQRLTIDNNDQLDGETLSAWLRGLTSLRRLSIEDCPAVTSLPRAEVLSHLTALKKLKITSLKALSSFGGGIHCLVSLEELSIEDCPELLDITTTTTAADSSRPSSSSALPSPARSVGTSTARIRKLEIKGNSSMQQIKTWLLQCPSLQELDISECPQLTGFGGNINDGGGGDVLEAALLNLSGTLQRLAFWWCQNLRSLPPRLRRLSSLRYLRMFDCPRVRSLPAAGLPESLRDLEIYVGGDVLLEDALLNLSGTLQRLEFYSCENLRSLPPRLRCLSSLQSLTIQDCPQIRSLPVAGLPDSLQNLSIYECHPELEERCKEGVGSDWPLISHIPDRWIGR